jgi:3-ketosteroid 9alpha-monooxygenase subunit B
MALPRPSSGVADAAHDHGFHSLRIGRIIRETPEASSFVLEIPDDLRAAFAYDAGQFCTFRMRVGGEVHLRCYSMSSSPAVDAEFQVTVKRTPEGVVSTFMNDALEAGDLVEVTRPAGVFCLTPGDGDLVAFSAGSGITPVHSLLKTALATTTRKVRLFYANRDADAVIFSAAIDELAGRYGPRLSVTHHLDVEHGFIEPGAVRDFASPSSDCEVYVCGPGPFMDIVEDTLLGDGFDAARLHIERFTPAEQLVEPDPAALSGSAVSRVTIDLGGRTDSTDHHPGTTILQTARQMGMAPPFSCEAGSCATCMAKLETGTADMHVNNALTDDEIAEGWILTCQAVPTSPVVHVVYSEEG